MTMPYPDACIIVFLKAPVEGQVKTRLSTDIGAPIATRLYRYMAHHCIATAVESELCPVQLWSGSTPAHEFYDDLQQQYSVPLYPQQGDDLGQRMFHALSTALESYRYAVIVGTDCPELTRNDFERALHRLQEGDDAVIAPALDGGYVMLGLGKIDAELFQDIHWSSTSVYVDTKSRLDQLGYHYTVLPAHRDIDQLADVLDLQQQAPRLKLSHALVSVLNHIASSARRV